MNSEELEISLRTEFENYLKDALADMRQEVSQLQEKVETELDKHKAQLDDVFQNAFNLLNNEKGVDAGFKESVVEHLRLARDEGARITATAMAEAEKLEDGNIVKDNSEEVARKFRDAVSEISGKTSQAEILKALVRHAEDFAPRGAFFIIKNEHFVGWRTFGKDKPENDDVIREIFFPVSDESILSQSIKKNASQISTFPKSEDATLYLNKIGYTNPINQVAIPLVVRGRGVAALYADGATVNVEALETLVRIASLTVELLASARGAGAKKESVTAPLPAVENVAPVEPRVEPKVETYEPIVTPYKPVEVEPTPYVPIETSTPFAEQSHQNFDSNSSFDAVSESRPIVTEAKNAFETESWGKPKVAFDDYSSSFESNSNASVANVDDFEISSPTNIETNDYGFQSNTSAYDFDSPAVEVVDDFSSAQSFANQEFESFSKPESVVDDGFVAVPIAKPDNFQSFDFGTATPQPVEPVVESVPVSTKPRFSDRNVDLPIDVAEDERRLHNDARRFARLLVSEIKLYNEQKVKEGRESNDLYDRLKEAIDRSREMYDKRVQPPVAAKFDYFHFELVNTLAEGEQSRLGSGYPGPTI